MTRNGWVHILLDCALILLITKPRGIFMARVFSRERRWLDSFFFQAEDGIRDTSVTGVQTCALPIYPPSPGAPWQRPSAHHRHEEGTRPRERAIVVLHAERDGEEVGRARLGEAFELVQIGRASCRERVTRSVDVRLGGKNVGQECTTL